MITRRLTDTSAALDRVKMESSIEIERVSLIPSLDFLFNKPVCL